MIKSLLMKATFVALFLLLVVTGLLFYQNQNLNKKNGELEKSLTAVKVANALQDANLKINQIVVTNVIEEKNKLATENKVITNEVRYALKNNDCAAKPIPSTVSDSLLKYATSLRSRSMHTDTGRADSTFAYTHALTYEDAILWIPPLLTVIAQCNADREAIRQIEKQRDLLNN